MRSDSSPSPLLDLQPLIHPKEKIYFVMCVFVSLFIYVVLASIILAGGPVAGTVMFYLFIGIVGYFLFHGVFLGHVRGNGVRVSNRQFPELNAMAEQHSRRLGMETPAIFVLQSGGVLNAFATRFLGRNFVILYSDVLALASQKGEKAVSFVLARAGHVRQAHDAPGVAVSGDDLPFLGGAYSRACEYTCDRFGNALEPEGGVDGLLVLAAGRDLYNQVNSTEFIRQRETESGFFVRFAEILSTHPNLPKRVAALDAVRRHESASPPPRSLIRETAAVI